MLGFRQELNAGFAADGYARVTGRPTPLVVSTGPGAFMTLAPIMEAFTAFVPLVVVSSQIRLEGIGKGRGHLHETPDQSASFAPLVKWTGRAESAEQIPAGPRRSVAARRDGAARAGLCRGARTTSCCARRETSPSASWTAARNRARHLRVQISIARPLARRSGTPVDRRGRRFGALGRKRRAPRARDAPRRAGGDDVHRQGRVPGATRARGRQRLGRRSTPRARQPARTSSSSSAPGSATT